MSKRKTIKPTLLLITVLLLAGCGSDQAAGGQATPQATTANQAAVAPTQESAAATSAPEAIAPTMVTIDAPSPTDVPSEATPTTQASEPASGASGGSAQEAIISSLRTQATVRTYRGLTTNTTDPSRPLTMTIEVVRPDRMRTIIDAGTFQRETINIGQTAYTKTANGWVKSEATGDMSTLNLLFADQSQVDTFVAENKENWADARLTGTEMVDEKPAKLYEFKVRVTTTLGDQTTTTDSPLKLWIGESDNLPYRLQSSAEVNVGGNDVTSTTTFSFFDYNADIKIDVPSPILTP